jgi:hypothetical protein
MLVQWSSDNFVDNILPGVALHYYKSHDGEIGKPPYEDDFAQGMQFAVKNGMFRNEMEIHDVGTRSFQCPAKGILTRLSMLTMGRDDRPHLPGVEEDESKVGTGFYNIYLKVARELKANPSAAKETLRVLDEKLETALRDPSQLEI